jgi:hypothetical protein
MKLLVTVMVLAPALAAADPEHFVTLDRQDDSSRLGGELSYLFLPNNNGGATSMRFDLHGQYVTPTGVGGYISIPFAYLSGGNQSDQAVGDLDVGAIYAVRLANPNTKLFLHGGLTLPTMKNSVTSAEIDGVASGARLSDVYLAVPEGTSLRLAISPTMRSGQLFLRGDFGLDANLSAASGTDISTVLRFQFGAGIDFGTAALMVESTNLYATRNNGGWINTAALSARFDAGTVYPYAALVIALDDDARATMDEALTVGLEGRLQ